MVEKDIDADRAVRWSDARENIWYWTGHTWTCETIALNDVILDKLPWQAGPYEVAL